MAISRKEIEHIASLARLDSTGGIFDRLADDMQGIVAMVDKLAELDLGDITDVINTERTHLHLAITVSVPVSLSVYTTEEWAELCTDSTSYAAWIARKGKVIYDQTA